MTLGGRGGQRTHLIFFRSQLTLTEPHHGGEHQGLHLLLHLLSSTDDFMFIFAALQDAVWRRQHVSSFGSWGYPEEFSIRQYLEPASQVAASGGTGCAGEGHLYPPALPHYFYCGKDSEDLYGLPAMAAYPKKVHL